jgi:hypothetical protein
MGKMKFSKDYISIRSIGVIRFWAGISAGLFTSIIISLAFNYTRETYRMLTGITPDLLILPDHEFLFYDIFFASLASCSGLAIAVWLWMNNPVHVRRKDRLSKYVSRTLILLSFWVFFAVVARMGTNLPIMLYTLEGYQNHLPLTENFWLMFVLIPLVSFLQTWMGVRLIYRTGNWIAISFLSCVILTFALLKTTGVNRDIVNTNYFLKYENELLYIDYQVQEAKDRYGIEFEDSSVSALRKWQTESSLNQVEAVKIAFGRENKVTLDTIILQKIMIHNMKNRYYKDYYHFRNHFIELWPYALPDHVLTQILRHGPGTPETEQLFGVLNEQIHLMNSSAISYDWYDLSDLSEIEKKRYFFYTPRIVTEQLIDVIEKLSTYDDYRMYYQNLKSLNI